MRVVVLGLLTPIIRLPSLVASRALRVDSAVLPSGGAIGGAGAVTAIGTAVMDALDVALGSNTSSVFWELFGPAPMVVIRTRPSAPTATPSGLAGRATRWTSAALVKSITLRETWL